MTHTKKTPKVAICLALPQWLLDKLADQKESTQQSRAVMIENALCSYYGWEKTK